MDAAERRALEASLSEELEMKVVIDEYCPEGKIFLGNTPTNPLWKDQAKRWLVLPVGVASTKNVLEVVKNAILKNQKNLSSPEHYNLMERIVSQRFMD